MKIENLTTPTALELKRCYLPIIFRAKCPVCGKECVKDCNSDYLSYPWINTPTKVNFYCVSIVDDKDIEHEFSINVILKITAEVCRGIYVEGN